MIKIQIGSILLNNDPRYDGEKVKVLEVSPGTVSKSYPHVVYQAGRRRAKVRLEDIKQKDEKHFNRGWTVIA